MKKVEHYLKNISPKQAHQYPPNIQHRLTFISQLKSALKKETNSNIIQQTQALIDSLYAETTKDFLAMDSKADLDSKVTTAIRYSLLEKPVNLIKLTIKRGKVLWKVVRVKRTNNHRQETVLTYQNNKGGKIQEISGKKTLELYDKYRPSKMHNFDPALNRHVYLTIPDFVKFKHGGKRYGSNKSTVVSGAASFKINRCRSDRDKKRI